jgi:uncharacterized coiled-coil DUF342 family protein
MEKKRVVIDLQQIDLLEQRVVKATELIRGLRRERDAAQARLAEAEQALARTEKEAAAAAQERQDLQEAADQIEALREERQLIRTKVTRMLEVMSSLDEATGEARRDH